MAYLAGSLGLAAHPRQLATYLTLPNQRSGTRAVHILGMHADVPPNWDQSGRNRSTLPESNSTETGPKYRSSPLELTPIIGQRGPESTQIGACSTGLWTTSTNSAQIRLGIDQIWPETDQKFDQYLFRNRPSLPSLPSPPLSVPSPSPSSPTPATFGPKSTNMPP